MAIRIDTNADVYARIIGEGISQTDLVKWLKGGLIQGMNGEDGRNLPFTYYVWRNYLSNGRALGKTGPTKNKWWRENRGWHHADTFFFYVPHYKRATAEIHAGFYATAISRMGGSTEYHSSLNYIKKSFREQGWISKAWRGYQGTKKTRDDINNVFVGAINKRLREANKTEV